MQEVWNWRVLEYWKQMKPEIQQDSFRNIMDMTANFGGFAASLVNKHVWVMNVVPVNESSKLKIIYDRGLIGTLHDWFVYKFIVLLSCCGNVFTIYFFLVINVGTRLLNKFRICHL